MDGFDIAALTIVLIAFILGCWGLWSTRAEAKKRRAEKKKTLYATAERIARHRREGRSFVDVTVTTP